MRKIVRYIRKLRRRSINKKNRERLINRQISIFSSNCIGGVIYHELGLEFLSPFINLYIEPKEFLKILKEPKKYMEYELVEKRDGGEKYPVGVLNDVSIYGVHYNDFEELKLKWNQRKKRIDWNNVYVIMVERDGCTRQDIEEFDKLDYAHKVVFVHKNMDDIKSAYYIKGTGNMDSKHKVIDITQYQGFISGKRYIDDFDYVDFFNKM